MLLFPITDPLYPPVSLLGVTSYFGNKYKQLRTIANIYKFSPRQMLPLSTHVEPVLAKTDRKCLSQTHGIAWYPLIAIVCVV